MNKLEQKFCTELQKWVQHNMKFTFCWEAKACRDGKLYYNDDSFAKERRNLAICGRHLVHKFSDISACGTIFDGISITESPGYLFVQFVRPRNKEFFIIEISAIEKDIESGSKYLNEEKAKKLAWRIGQLK